MYFLNFNAQIHDNVQCFFPVYKKKKMKKIFVKHKNSFFFKIFSFSFVEKITQISYIIIFKFLLSEIYVPKNWKYMTIKSYIYIYIERERVVYMYIYIYIYI